MLLNRHCWVAVFSLAAIIVIAACRQNQKDLASKQEQRPSASVSGASTAQWIIPDTSQLTNAGDAGLIKYGRALVVNTSYYFGPRGVIAHSSNGLNCQNCHLDAGTKLFGNNFSLVATTYPRYKERSASVETVVKKVEDCFERSLNGRRIDIGSREMKAFVSYLAWIGKNVQRGTRPEGSGIEEPAMLGRAADTARGRIVYVSRCQVCHGKNGEGVLNVSARTYSYPPLWGPHGYNIGASIYRLSKFAGFVKSNMPLNADKKSQLSAEQSWDVAAFVNSQFHPYKNISRDWPKLATKPFDYPFGPYADQQFSAGQRKFGPFGPIKKYYAALGAGK